jgi:hypothetical protein
MTEYTEPSNAQLAAFMTVLAKNNPAFAHLRVSPAILEFIFEKQPEQREMALGKHRAFQAELNKHTEQMMNGELKCAYFLRSGKRCPNFNLAGTQFCGLHQEDE